MGAAWVGRIAWHTIVVGTVFTTFIVGVLYQILLIIQDNATAWIWGIAFIANFISWMAIGAIGWDMKYRKWKHDRKFSTSKQGSTASTNNHSGIDSGMESG